MNDVFIVLLDQEFDGTIAMQECLYRKIITGESSKTFHFFAPRASTLYFVISLQAGCKASSSLPHFFISRVCDARLKRSQRDSANVANYRSLLPIDRRHESGRRQRVFP